MTRAGERITWEHVVSGETRETAAGLELHYPWVRQGRSRADRLGAARDAARRTVGAAVRKARTPASPTPRGRRRAATVTGDEEGSDDA